MREVPLTQGQVAIIDDEDYERVMQHKWCALFNDGIWYAVRAIRVGNKKSLQQMHRFILEVQRGDRREVDHKDHNGLNNQKENLRVCTHAQNMQNCRMFHGRSKYRGVMWYKITGRWLSSIRIQGKSVFQGYFTTQEQAAMAYDLAALTHYGQYACTNFF
jgi:hypothetical protein